MEPDDPMGDGHDTMSNDPQEATGAGDGRADRGSIGATIRRDGAEGRPPGGGDSSPGDGLDDGRARRWARLELGFWIALVVTMLIFAAIPIVNQAYKLQLKDYGLWYQVGLAESKGYDIYPRPRAAGCSRSCIRPRRRPCWGCSARWARPG